MGKIPRAARRASESGQRQRQDERRETQEDGGRRPHRRQGDREEEEEGRPQDRGNRRQETAKHLEEARRQHHPRDRGGQHLPGRQRHPLHQPKGSGSIAANTYIISGNSQNKKLQDLLPGIIPQLGPDNLNNLRKIAEQFQKQEEAAGAAKDEDIPEVENFEAAE